MCGSTGVREYGTAEVVHFEGGGGVCAVELSLKIYRC